MLSVSRGRSASAVESGGGMAIVGVGLCDRSGRLRMYKSLAGEKGDGGTKSEGVTCEAVRGVRSLGPTC